MRNNDTPARPNRFLVPDGWIPVAEPDQSGCTRFAGLPVAARDLPRHVHDHGDVQVVAVRYRDGFPSLPERMVTIARITDDNGVQHQAVQDTTLGGGVVHYTDEDTAMLVAVQWALGHGPVWDAATHPAVHLREVEQAAA